MKCSPFSWCSRSCSVPPVLISPLSNYNSVFISVNQADRVSVRLWTVSYFHCFLTLWCRFSLLSHPDITETRTEPRGILYEQFKFRDISKTPIFFCHLKNYKILLSYSEIYGILPVQRVFSHLKSTLLIIKNRCYETFSFDEILSNIASDSSYT